MPNTNLDKSEIFVKDDDQLNKKIKPVPVPSTDISIDVDDEFYKTLIEAGTSAQIDIGQLNTFSQLSQNRETLYQVLDTMAEDSTISSMLEIYTEDATETNDLGEIVWAESSDDKIQKYITFLLNSLNVDKNIYQWVYSLIKYGDIYLKLFRQSDFNDNLFDNKNKSTLNEKFESISEEKDVLDESVIVKAYNKNDKLVNFLELVPNPAEMFELTKFGKSYAYIKTNTIPQNVRNDDYLTATQYLYKFRRNDVTIYDAVSFVHGTIQDDTSRLPEKIQIFMDNTMDSDDYNVYTVRRGKSILYNLYKIWRQMMLLENSLMLNRLTKSSILRVVEVEVGDMPKERIGPHLQRIKSLVEQKSSIDDGNMMSEYTNPGPMENNIYVPTHGGMGAISTQQIGGDVNVKDIADIDYFKNKFYAAARIPKQFLGDTDDSTGFNGGTSLSIVSSRYAKTIKRIQAVMTQALTDAINILLIDRGLDSYVNKFTLKMQPPVTQEELDKRDNEAGKIQLSDDILRMVDNVENPIIKLKMTKSLLSRAITNDEVISLIQEAIDELESSSDDEDNNFDNALEGTDDDFGSIFGGDSDTFNDSSDSFSGDGDLDTGAELEDSLSSRAEDSDEDLPTPAELGAGDMSEVI